MFRFASQRHKIGLQSGLLILVHLFSVWCAADAAAQAWDVRSLARLRDHGLIRPPSHLLPLAECLSDPDPVVRQNAVRDIAVIADRSPQVQERVRAALDRAVNDSDTTVRVLATIAIAHLSTVDGERVMPQLISILGSGTQLERREVAKACIKLGSTAVEAGPRLTRLLADPDRILATLAAQALIAQGRGDIVESYNATTRKKRAAQHQHPQISGAPAQPTPAMPSDVPQEIAQARRDEAEREARRKAREEERAKAEEALTKLKEELAREREQRLASQPHLDIPLPSAGLSSNATTTARQETALNTLESRMEELMGGPMDDDVRRYIEDYKAAVQRQDLRAAKQLLDLIADHQNLLRLISKTSAR